MPPERDPEPTRRPCAVPGCPHTRLAGAMGWQDMICDGHAETIRTREDFERETRRHDDQADR